jgi:hypothetical protein
VDVPLPKSLKRVKLQVLPHNQLGLSWLPVLEYNPADPTYGMAGGEAEVNPTTTPGVVHVQADTSTLVMPPVSRATASLQGSRIRMIPFAKVTLQITRLEGNADIAAGKVEMDVVSTAVVQVGRIYRSKPLKLNMRMTTETAAGKKFRCWGTRTDKSSGFTRLAGVTKVARTGSWLLDLLLGLPAEAFMVLETSLVFS